MISMSALGYVGNHLSEREKKEEQEEEEEEEDAHLQTQCKHKVVV
jgi:hypothetical protein